MRAWSIGLAALALSACASTLPAPREDVAQRIADDAAAFNDAYGRAVSAQILLNIMRSRDRLPRHYLSMTGISDSPSQTHQQAGGIGSIALGDGASPWGVGSLAVSRETQRRPNYAVQPFDAETLTRAAFQPTQSYVFAHYWRSGWPRDLLMLVMVEAIETRSAGGVRAIAVNEANTIFENCHAGVDTQGCRFVRELRGFLEETATQPVLPDFESGRDVCGLIAAYAPAAPVRPASGAQQSEGRACDPVFVIGEREVRLRLRSLDDMVYYVGELLRAGSMRAGESDAIEAQVLINAAGLYGGGRGVPLFRVLPERAAPPGVYAAEVEYGGVRYIAGPAVGRSCGEASASGRCQDNAEQGDRSSSVLSLIAEILALNQSPDAIRAPNRLIAE